MNDLISRQAAIDAINTACDGVISFDGDSVPSVAAYFEDAILGVPPAKQWIPFKIRPLTAEEKEEHPEWNFFLDCNLPDDGDAILISTKRYVAEDTFYNDEYGAYLDSGLSMGEDAIAWQPLPEPYKEG